MRSPRRVALLAAVVACLAAPSAHATIVRTVAGGGTPGPTGTWHAASSLLVGFGAPQAVAMDHTPATDQLDYYVTDTTGCRIFKVDGDVGYSGAIGPIEVYVGLMEICRDSNDFAFTHDYNGAAFPPTGAEPKLKNPGQLASLADGRLIWSENGQG